MSSQAGSASAARLFGEFLDRLARGAATFEAFVERHPEHAADLRQLYERWCASLSRFGAVVESAISPRAAGRVAHYRKLNLIGSGGQGEVWLAEDERLGRRVALKTLHRASELSLARFTREAALTSRLEHPSICAVYDSGVAEGVAFIAMRYVDGPSLASLLSAEKSRDGAEPRGKRDSSTGPRTASELTRYLRIIAATARGLHAAHEAGVIHRDIKPGNILVARGDQPVIVDFGLARESEPTLDELTHTGDFLGTPAYMAPEQVASRRNQPLDLRADVWALGVTLYEVLTWRRPFDRRTTQATCNAILGESPEPITAFNPTLSRQLDLVVRTSLQKELPLRYRTAEAFAEDLDAVLDGRPIRARPPTFAEQLASLVRRNKAPSLVVAVALIALLLGMWGATQQTRAALAAERGVVAALRLLRTELPNVSLSAYTHVKPGVLEDGDAVIDDLFAVFERSGFELDPTVSAAQQRIVAVMRERGSVSDDERRAVLGALYRAADAMFMGDYAYAGEQRERQLLCTPPTASEAQLARVLREQPLRVDQWLLVRDVISEVETDPAYFEAWSRILQTIRSGEGGVVELLEHDRALGIAHGRALLLTRFVDRIWGDAGAVPYWRWLAGVFPDEFEPHAKLCFAAQRAAVGRRADQVVPPAEAIAHGERARGRVPGWHWLSLALASAYLQAGEFDLALANARSAVDLAPIEPVMWQYLGWVHHRRMSQPGRADEFEAARAAYEASLALDPMMSSSHRLVCALEEEHGDVDQALADLRRRQQLCPPCVDDLTELELGILGRASRLDELARLPQRWSDDDPRRTVALFQVSATFDGLSQLEHQIAFLELGLELRSQQGQTRQLSADPDAEVAAARERLKLLMGTEPAESADDRHRLAERVSKRGEHLRAFELYAELVAEMESFEDPVAWFRRSGYDPWSTYRFAAREAVECMRGNGYLFVPRTLLAWHPDWPCVAAIPGASSSPKLAQDARPSLATSPLFDDALRARCRESIEQWTGRAVDALLLDTLRAKPALDAAARAQVIEEIRATLDALGPDFDPTVSPPISRARQALDELGAKLGE